MKSGVVHKKSSQSTEQTPFFKKAEQSSFFGETSTPFFNNTPVQAKLTIGEPNDKYEQEADAMADKVVQRLAAPGAVTENYKGVQAKTLGNSITPFVQAKCTACEEEDKLQKKEEEGVKELPLQRKPIFESNAEPPDDDKPVQRKCADCEKEEQLQKKSDSSGSGTASSQIESSLNSSKGGGSPIPPATREQMESSFGANFSNVRVHTDSAAADMSNDLNAHAFTHQNDIYFNTAKYDTNSKQGQHLLAHELTHTIQQTGNLVKSPDLQKQDANDSVSKAEQLISDNTTLGFLDEEELGKQVAALLPVGTGVANEVLNQLPGTDKDDVSLEITNALFNAGKLQSVDEALRISLVNYLVEGFVGDNEETAIARIWISFEPILPDVTEKHKPVWKKSLWESDDLTVYTQSIRDDFKLDVQNLARKFLSENKATLISEAKRMGINLEGKEPIAEREGYMDAVRAIAPNVLKLQNYQKELRDIKVGYTTTCDEGGCWDSPTGFNPESKPESGPAGTENPAWPTWEKVKGQYDRVSAIVSAFTSLYPSLYIMIQTGKLEDLSKLEDSTKAKQLIDESMRKTLEKINESDTKIATADIEYYDLIMIQSKLFSGSKDLYDPLHAWEKNYYQDIAKDELKSHETRQFWIDLGLSLVAAAALIAAPFTGGLSAAFLIGAGLGIGAGQAAVSWEKYQDMSTIAGADVKEELTLISDGQVDAQLLDAIIQTVGVFLDAYGAKAASTTAKASRAASELAEKEIKQQLAEQLKKKMLKEAGKDAGLTLAGTGLSIGLHEMEEDEPVPDFTALVTQYDTFLPEGDDDGGTDVNRFVIQRVPANKPATGAASSSLPIIMSGTEFETYIEKALKTGSIGNVPKMTFVIPGQYTGSGWGIDRIGIEVNEITGKISVYQFEMKFVSQGSPFIPGLGNPSVGGQTGQAWTEKAIDGFLNSQHPTARAGKEKLRRALKKIYPNEEITIAHMTQFLQKKLTKAPVRIIVPDYANLSKLYKQAAALFRWGRKALVIKAAIK